MCNLNWLPFIVANLMELTRRLVLGRHYDPFKDCATLYFFARKTILAASPTAA
jgi:hypothetical protein